MVQLPWINPPYAGFLFRSAAQAIYGAAYVLSRLDPPLLPFIAVLLYILVEWKLVGPFVKRYRASIGRRVP